MQNKKASRIRRRISLRRQPALDGLRRLYDPWAIRRGPLQLGVTGRSAPECHDVDAETKKLIEAMQKLENVVLSGFGVKPAPIKKD